MGTTEYDVIVVGGGPAGASAAKAAVDRGASVLLLERKKMPRHKPCCGYLFSESREFLAEHYGRVPEGVEVEPPEFAGIRIFLPGAPLLDLPIKGIGVWRNRFDQWLCEQSGAEIMDETGLIDFAEWKDRVELVCHHEGKRIELTARSVIAANGAYSTITRKIDPTFYEGVVLLDANEQYHRCHSSLEPGYLYIFVNPEFGAYPAVHVKDELVVTDVLVQPGQSMLDAREGLHAMLKKDYGFDSRDRVLNIGCRSTITATKNRFCLGTDRVLIAGDAAGFINLMGEGISSALTTGYLAGEAAGACDGSPPGPLYRGRALIERERTVREWSVPSIISGKVRPELRAYLKTVPPLKLVRLAAGLFAWQRSGDIVTNIVRDSIEVMIRRLLHGDYDFRS